MFFLKSLTDSERKVFRGHLRHLDVAPGETIVREGEPATAMYFMEFGMIRLFKGSSLARGENEQTSAVLKAGDFFGEEALLGENNLYQQSGVSLESGILHVLTRSAFDQIMINSIPLGTKILLELSRSYREVLDDSETRGTLVLFYGPRDGGGKTTLAINTAILLSQMIGQPVAYLDADFQLGNAALIVGSSMTPNISQLIQASPVLTMDRMRWCLHSHFGVDFLWGPDIPQDSDLITRESLHKILNELRRHYPWIVVECKSHIDEQTLLLWDQADHFFLVGTPDLGFLERAMRLTRLFRSLEYNFDRFFGIMNLSGDKAQDFLDEFRKILQRPVFNLHSANDLFRQAEIIGKPLAIAVPDSDYVREVRNILSNLLGKAYEPQKKDGGIFTRLAGLFS